jgi:hypothetical protein
MHITALEDQEKDEDDNSDSFYMIRKTHVIFEI